MQQHDLPKLLDHIVSICQQAGDIIMEFYNCPWKIKHLHKPCPSDNSPLSNADLKANEFIVNKLKLLTPQLTIISEESVPPSYEFREKLKTFWLVDPLDGSKSFLAGNEQFTVNIALITQHYPVLGVIYHPPSKTTYYACKNHGTFKQQDNKAAILLNKDINSHKIISSYHHDNNKLQEFIRKLDIEYEHVKMSSSLKFCLIAEQKYFLYPRLSPTSQWDTAAGQIIVEEAQGAVIDFSGEKLEYSQKNDFINKNFLCISNKQYPYANILNLLRY